MLTKPTCPQTQDNRGSSSLRTTRTQEVRTMIMQTSVVSMLGVLLISMMTKRQCYSDMMESTMTIPISFSRSSIYVQELPASSCFTCQSLSTFHIPTKANVLQCCNLCSGSDFHSVCCLETHLPKEHFSLWENKFALVLLRSYFLHAMDELPCPWNGSHFGVASCFPNT